MIKKFISQEKEIIEHVFWRALQVFGKQGISFLIFFLSAAFLTPEEFGLYNIIVAYMFLFLVFIDFGLSTAVSKFVAEHAEKKKKINAILFTSALLILFIFIAITLVLVIFGSFFFGDKYKYILMFLPFLLFAPLSFLYDGVFRGLGKFKILSMVFVCVGLVSLIAVYFLVKYFGLAGAIQAQNLLYFLLALSLFFLHKGFVAKVDIPLMKKVLSYSLIVGLSSLGYFLFTRVNLLVLSWFNLVVEAGYYELVNKIVTLLIVAFTVLAQVLAPKVTRLYAKGKKEEVLAMYKRYMLLCFAGGLFFILFIFLFFPLLLKHFLTQYNTPEVLLSMNLLLPILISQALATVAATGFSIATGHAKLNMEFLWIFGLVNCIIGPLLVWQFGYIGIIFATLSVKIISDALFVGIYYYKLKGDKEEKKEKKAKKTF